MPATRYAEVNDVLETLVPRINDVLGENLVGLYLFGSLVTGDFDLRLSDIDLAAIVARPLSPGDLEQLERLHAGMAHEFPVWDDRIEVGYLTRADINPFDPRAIMAIISPGEPFHPRIAEHSWLFNLRVVREAGITLWGPDPRTVIGPISDAALVAGLRARMAEWRAWTDEEIPPMHAGGQAYVVLTMCRALRAFRTGDWASKRQSAEWAMRQASGWVPLIRQALAWREAEPTGPVDLAAAQAQMLAFTREVTGQIAGA